MGLGLAINGLAGTAHASSFSVSPTRLALAPGTTSVVLTLTNQHDRAIRFQLSVFAWDQSEDGRMQLADTADVVVYPPLVSLDPGESRRIRVGTVVPFGEIEKTYRLLVEELPDDNAPVTPGGVQVRTRMGIPVFLQGRGKTPNVVTGIEHASVADGVLSFDLVNSGMRHALPQRIQVRGTAADGHKVFSRDVDGWYLLAGHRQAFHVALPDDCVLVAAVEVEATFAHGTFNERVDVPPAACPVR